MREWLFFCGRPPSPRDERRATLLMLTGRLQNVNRKIEAIETRMVADLPNHLRDLLDIATYVFMADRIVSRGGATLPNMGSNWRRRFRFSIAVRDPEHWNAPDVKSALEDLLGFLSDDRFRFDFFKSDELPTFPSRLALTSIGSPPSRYDQVLMFSGGLDSLAGAVRELARTNDRIVLVSHQSSDWVFSRQRDLASTLSANFPGRVLHVPVEITMGRALHDAEFTQRTRTFLFFAIGSVVAEAMGCARIRFFENGIMSFNLPIAPQIVGSRATRSTHPLALAQMSAFASNVLGHPFEVANPFIWQTKAEVVRLIDQHGQSDLIARSISCTHIRKSGQRAHCGECAQCLHRRFGTLAAGLSHKDPVEGYDVELLAENRMGVASRSMCLNLVASALDYPRLSVAGFMNKYAGEVLGAAKALLDESIDATVQRTYELHSRYGAEVGKVIDDAIRNYAPHIREQTLPPGCLLRAVIADNQVEVDRTALDDPFSNAKLEQGREDFRHLARIELACDELRKRLVIEGLGDVGTAAHFVLVSILVAQYRADRADELKPGNHRFVPAETLMDLLRIDSEAALRQRISEFRRRVVELARDRWGIPLGRDVVIENKFGAGYRLHPEVVVIDSAQIKTPDHK